VFSRLYRVPCWGVKPGIFPSLTLEFGEPQLHIREPMEPSNVASPKVQQLLRRRHVVVHGAWHLWIYYCHWSVFHNEKLVGDSSSPKRVQRAAHSLNGQALIAFDLTLRGCTCVFEFDLGGRLVTRPCNRHGEQWLLFTPSGKVLVLRADKRYSYHSKHSVPANLTWLVAEDSGPTRRKT